MIRVGKYNLSESVYDILLRVKSELINGKLRQIQKRGNQIRITCPCHADGQEDTGSCFVDCDTGMWHCFACHESGNFSKLVGECFDADESFGKKWLITNYVGDSIIEVDNHQDFFLDVFYEKKTEYLDESILDSYEDWHPYLAKRHLSKEVCEKFKVKYDKDSQMIVFPVYDTHNKLYMLTKRSVNSKKFLIDKDKEKPVYLLNTIIRENRTSVVVAESQINALTLWTWDMPAIAMFGTGTNYQFKLLNKSGIRHFTLAFDGDEAGKRATKKFIDKCRKDVLISVVCIPQGKDVNDLTEEEYKNLKVLTSHEWLLYNK